MVPISENIVDLEKGMVIGLEIAVLSDIHGNYVALEKCIQFAEVKHIKTFIFLGDYVGELAYPQKTMEIIYSLKEKHECYFIKGNKEDYWLHYDNTWKEKDSTTGCLYYTYHNLTRRDLDFFETLPIKRSICFTGYPVITVCHGSPRKVNEKMLPDNKNTYAIMENDIADYIICGHTHVQNTIEYSRKTVWNPGSVGVSLHSGGKAQFLILKGEDSSWKKEFVSLDYDVEQVIEHLYDSGLYDQAPSWCRVSENLLKTGEISHGSVLNKAMSLCHERNGNCIWPDIPEEYWQQAIKEMIG